jgi:hypothetical protein
VQGQLENEKGKKMAKRMAHGMVQGWSEIQRVKQMEHVREKGKLQGRWENEKGKKMVQGMVQGW